MTAAASRRGARTGRTIADELSRALDVALTEDPTTMVMGEDVGVLGGVFRITAGLRDRHGADRVVDTPLAEAGLVGTGVGLAMNGMRPIIEIQFDGFVFPAMNQICTHVARMAARVGDPSVMPMTIRIPVGGRIRATELHSESPETYFAYTPDLRVIAASTPDTVGALLLAAIRSDEPVVFLEPKRMYRRERAEPEEIVEEVALDRVRAVEPGDDALIVSYGPMLDVARLAARTLAADDGARVGVLDLVSLAPLDVDGILEHAARSGRVIVVGEGIRRCSISSEVVSLLATEGFSALRAAPVLLSAPNRPYPPAHAEDEYLVHASDVVRAVRKVLP